MYDCGEVDIVVCRSTDDGASWGPVKTITTRSWRETVGLGTYGTCQNPCAVVDRLHGKIWLFFNGHFSGQGASGRVCQKDIDQHGQRRIFLAYSENDGLDWSEPVEMTDTLLPPGATWDGMAPGAGIQTAFANPGRLIVPAYSTIGSDSVGRVIYSDDLGGTWAYEMLPKGTSESAMAECSDGRLLRSDRAVIRSWRGRRPYMKLTLGDTASTREWSFMQDVNGVDLPTPVCQGSLLRYTSDVNRILFLNPASPGRADGPSPRVNLTIRVSLDDGGTWNDGLCLTPGTYGGYTSMAKTGDLRIGVLWEKGVRGGTNDVGVFKDIQFEKHRVQDVLGGAGCPG